MERPTIKIHRLGGPIRPHSDQKTANFLCRDVVQKGPTIPGFKKAQESLGNLSIPSECSRRRGTFAFGQPFFNGCLQDDASELLLLRQRQIEFFGEPARPVHLLDRTELRQKLLRLGPVSLAGAAQVLATVDAVTNPPVLRLVLAVQPSHSEANLR